MLVYDMNANNKMEQRLKSLQTKLDKSDADYFIVEKYSDQHVVINFIGSFLGESVVWQASIRSLENYAQEMFGGKQASLKQFIEISELEDAYKIVVGLNIPKIDEASIKKAIIMIRKYKRLHIGRHEYGEAIQFNLK